MSNKSSKPTTDESRVRRNIAKKGTFAVRTLQQLAASTLGKMARGKKKTMTKAALRARRKNGRKLKVNFKARLKGGR